MPTEEEIISYLVISIGKKFKTFGDEHEQGSFQNPIAAAMMDEPLQFAMGVDVKEVVTFILSELGI